MKSQTTCETPVPRSFILSLYTHLLLISLSVVFAQDPLSVLFTNLLMCAVILTPRKCKLNFFCFLSVAKAHTACHVFFILHVKWQTHDVDTSKNINVCEDLTTSGLNNEEGR